MTGILDSSCGLESVNKIAHTMMPSDTKWDLYHYPGKAFVTKVEDPNTGRWAMIDCRETLTGDEIRDRISYLKQEKRK